MMATKKNIDDGSTTAVRTSENPYGFSGETCEIKLFKAESGEPQQPFFGLNGYTAILQRDKWMRVPVEVADALETLMYTVSEPSEDAPDDHSKNVWADRARFPLQRRA